MNCFRYIIRIQTPAIMHGTFVLSTITLSISRSCVNPVAPISPAMGAFVSIRKKSDTGSYSLIYCIIFCSSSGTPDNTGIACMILSPGNLFFSSCTSNGDIPSISPERCKTSGNTSFKFSVISSMSSDTVRPIFTASGCTPSKICFACSHVAALEFF